MNALGSYLAPQSDLEHIVAMRSLLPLIFILFAATGLSQDLKSENPLKAHWSKLRHDVEGPKGFTLFGRGMRINPHGQYELWVKVTPKNATAFVKHYALPARTAYVLQYATVDCSKRLLLLEKTAAFDSANSPVSGRLAGIVPGSVKDAVKPGSIGDAIFRSVCEDPSLDFRSDP